MPPPFTVRSGVSPEKDLGSWDTTGSIAIPGTLTVAGVVSGSNISATPPVTAVAAGDATVIIGGTATAPTVRVNAVAEAQVTSLVADLAAKAPLASPTFTGTVTAATLNGTTLAGSADVTSNAFSVPRGLVRRVSRTSDSTAITGGAQATAQGVLSLQVTNLVAGRLYLVGCPSLAGSSQVANTLVYTLTGTTDNTTPTSSSTILMMGESELPTINRTETFGAFYFVHKAVTVNLFVRLCIFARAAGGLSATRGDTTYPLELHIFDIGTDPGTSGGTVI